MPNRDLQAKYGNSNTRTLTNRAIRAELVGGDHCLDALNAFDSLKQKWKERGWVEGLEEINAGLEAAQKLHRYMKRIIRERYGMPPEET